MTSEKVQLSEPVAKMLMVWAAAHIAAYCILFRQGPFWLAAIIVVAYFLCILRIDWLVWLDGSPEAIAAMAHYWAAASVCMALWIAYGEPELRGCGGAVEALLFGLAAPYGPLLSCGLYTSECTPFLYAVSRGCLYVVLAWCCGHWLGYHRLRRRGRAV